MPRNVEIKAKIDSVNSIAHLVEPIASEGPILIAQDDTFFWCESGRMKLRMFSKNKGELIYYQRANETGPKESFYIRTLTEDPLGLTETLKLAYGVMGRVVKHRILYRVGRTRIHLDTVEGLGQYLELEVVLNESDSIAAGVDDAQDLLSKLGVQRSQLIDRAYVDLLSDEKNSATC
jgi:predicted adenylyl cyclase CyaB